MLSRDRFRNRFSKTSTALAMTMVLVRQARCEHGHNLTCPQQRNVIALSFPKSDTPPHDFPYVFDIRVLLNQSGIADGTHTVPITHC